MIPVVSAEGCERCPILTRCTVEKLGRVMFRVLHPDIQTPLRNLSKDGFIYIGREGIGLSYVFRKEIMRVGTLKAIENCKGEATPEEIRLLELTAIEGPKWLCYQRVIQALWSCQKHEAAVKPVVTEDRAMSQEVWAQTEER